MTLIPVTSTRSHDVEPQQGDRLRWFDGRIGDAFPRLDGSNFVITTGMNGSVTLMLSILRPDGTFMHEIVDVSEMVANWLAAIEREEATDGWPGGDG